MLKFDQYFITSHFPSIFQIHLVLVYFISCINFVLSAFILLNSCSFPKLKLILHCLIQLQLLVSKSIILSRFELELPFNIKSHSFSYYIFMVVPLILQSFTSFECNKFKEIMFTKFQQLQLSFFNEYSSPFTNDIVSPNSCLSSSFISLQVQN